MRLLLLMMLTAGPGLSLLFQGCDTGGGGGGGKHAALLAEVEQNRRLWASAGIDHYQVTSRQICFCLPSQLLTEVKDGQVVQVVQLPEVVDGSEGWNRIRTVDDAFAVIEEFVERSRSSTGLDETGEINVTFHPQLGYPVSVSMDWILGAVDDEVTYQFSDLIPLGDGAPTILLDGRVDSGDRYEFRGARLDRDILEMDVSYGGGCADHDFYLIAQRSFKESFPVQNDLTLKHEDYDDPCDAWISTTLRFDLTALKRAYQEAYGDGGTLILNLPSGNLAWEMD